MARRIFCFLLVQGFVCKVISIYAQPTLQQYLQLTGSPHSAQTIPVPATQHSAPAPKPPNNPPTNPPRPASGLPSFSALALPELVSRLQQLPAIQQTAALPNHFANQVRPTTGLTALSALGLPGLVSGLQQMPTQQHGEVKTASSSIDSNLLNNLAIALQLLIVSNILNAPPPADSSSEKSKEIAPCSEPNLNYAQAVMPNSNFVGATSFSEPMTQAYRPTRNSMHLMSPYEALGSSSPYSDAILSQYGSINPRQDFQSPYSMITDNDLFSMNDLF